MLGCLWDEDAATHSQRTLCAPCFFLAQQELRSWVRGPVISAGAAYTMCWSGRLREQMPGTFNLCGSQGHRMLGEQGDKFHSCPSGSLVPGTELLSLFCWAKSAHASSFSSPPTHSVNFSLTPLVWVLFLFWTSMLLRVRISCENIFKSWKLTSYH